ncbi:MAG: ATP synthase F1 subunit delta [Pirellulaceae bacterium]
MMMAESSDHRSFDSSREHLGAVYAKGLLGAAEGQGLTERILTELNSLVDDVLARVVNFEAFLASPRVSLEEKTQVLDRAFAAQMTPLFLNFLKVMARHGRLNCLREVRSSAHKQYNLLRGRVEVLVKTATPLSGPLRSQIEQRLVVALGKPVDLQCSVHAGLLGGMLVRVGDTVFDGSLDNRLDKMQFEMADRTVQRIRDSLPRFLVTD